jgi:flavodoxin
MKMLCKVSITSIIAGCLLLVSGLYSAAEETSSDKTLMLYYSRTGNTKAACEALQKKLGADMQEIRDLNGRDSKFGMISGMLKTIIGMQTDIEPETVDFDPYDTLIISAPIWASKFGLAMRTFVERSSFEGKQIIIFITADSFVEKKYQDKHKALVEKSGGSVIGHFQVQAMDIVNDEKMPRTKEKIIEQTLKLAPAIKACITAEN